ncbi:hypothetical protein Taro_021008 [Colocasia esculenta]|uniref:Uncharacterized protein n=1 Tax=Colocasia esculenta TaxID=4460 RepID=A0A843UXU4_COLES|nr:hypothetical protein [Colocasia esculenta]
MEQDLEETLLPPKAFLGVIWAWFPLGRSVSTHRQTVSTPLVSTVLTASWDGHLVSTHSHESKFILIGLRLIKT